MTELFLIPKNISFPKEEEKVLKLWAEKNVFKRSISERKDAGQKPYSFYDGPPFATGLPHYGHFVASTIKDTVARYFTMQGHYVERRFGWDTHGLPIEMEMEKALGLSGPKSIREYGIGKFNEACRSVVLKYTKEWRRIITRLGRFVDFDNDYKTFDKSFMESVWWVFCNLYDKGLIYEGFRVMPYSARLSTSLSNFEANLNYQEVQDPSVIIKAKTKDEPNTFFLIWTTTPWTIPSNLAIAVNENLIYVKIKSNKDSNYYIISKDRLEHVFKKDDFEIVKEYTGKDLVNKTYEPIYKNTNYTSLIDTANCFKIISSSHVAADSGTGLVHMAPAFGEDDFIACRANNIPIFDPIDEEGRFKKEVPDLLGLNFKDADKVILKSLKDLGFLFDRSTIVHSYPFCWRSNTPLMYKAMPVWFLDVPKIKDKMIEHNKTIHWVPESVGQRRFSNWLENASDWNISRNRFWGTPIPIWRCECGHKECMGSVAKLEEKTNMKLDDIHSHFIDHLSFPCQKCQKPMKRIPEVFDCWFESGSMPVAQSHYPFENKLLFEKSFPADFIAEGLDQTRGWFYTLLVISTALFDSPPFKNVIVNGLVLAKDGSKMSKSKKNFPDPESVIDAYGADAVRAYLISSPVVRAEPLAFNEDGVKEIVRNVLLPIYNCWSFFAQYANIDNFDPRKDLNDSVSYKSIPEIDRWILSKLNTLIYKIDIEMTGYYLYKTIPPVLEFIDDLTNWYIRKNRRRFWKSPQTLEEKVDKLRAYKTLYEVLVNLSKILSPILPFMAENLYQGLVFEGPDSVHLCDFPKSKKYKIDIKLEEDVKTVRTVVALTRALREKHRIKTRQPLEKLTVVAPPQKLLAIKNHIENLKSETNVKNIILEEDESSFCELCLKPNFKTLGPRLGKELKAISLKIEKLDKEAINKVRIGQNIEINDFILAPEDFTIERKSKPDIMVMTENDLTVALDSHITPKLKSEGLMREALSLLQKQRKTYNFSITDRIDLKLYSDSKILNDSLLFYKDYLIEELLVKNFSLRPLQEKDSSATQLDIDGEELFVLMRT